MNTVKKMVLLKNGKMRTVTPYQILEETGLTLEEIILSAKGKPIKSDGKYSVFEVKVLLYLYKKGNKMKNSYKLYLVLVFSMLLISFGSCKQPV